MTLAANDSPQPHLTLQSPSTRGGQTIVWRFWIPLLLIILLASGLRLYRLGDYPQPFNQDEMVIGYDAWSLWTTGADQYGHILPLHFQGFGDYLPGLTHYLIAPFVGVLGLNEANTRLPIALMGIFTVFLIGVLVRRWFGPEAGLLAALFFSIDPWAINFGRYAFTNSTAPVFTVLALYTYTRFITQLKSNEGQLAAKGRPLLVWLVLSSLCFALLTLTYSTMKLEALLLFDVCLLAAAPLLWRHRKMALLWIGLYIVFAAPEAIDQIAHWQAFQTHFNHISILEKPDWVSQFLTHYSQAYNPYSLLLDGLGGPIVYPPGEGPLFWLEGLFWIAAAVGLVQQRSRLAQIGFSLPILLGLWVALCPIAASLTDSVNTARLINFLPLPELLAGYGAAIVLNLLGQTRFGWRLVLYGGILPGLITLTIFVVLFARYFYSLPALEAGVAVEYVPYSRGLRTLLEHITQEATPCDEIWLEPTTQTFIYYLFLTRYPASRYQKEQPVNHELVDGWVHITHFDNIYFGYPVETHVDADPQCLHRLPRIFFATHLPSTDPGWREFTAVNNSKGEPIWRTVMRDTDF